MRLIVRADVSSRMGTGHLMRCLALAQAWQDSGGDVEVVTRCTNAALLGRLEREGLTVHALASPDDLEVLRAVSGGGPAACVVDGYHFGPDYQKAMQELFHPVLVIDDLADQPHYHADILLNHNLHARGLSYPCAPSVRRLLGPRFALLRREFRRWKGWQRGIEPVASRILVSMGGSDPDNATLSVLRALERCLPDNPEVVILAGAANSHLDELRKWVEERPNYQLHLNAEDVAQLIAWADFAVSAAGSTVWELCFMGLPAALVTLAENQVPVAERLALSGAAISLGWHAHLDAERIARELVRRVFPRDCREAMSRAGRILVDGDGASRVAGEIAGQSRGRGDARTTYPGR